MVIFSQLRNFIFAIQELTQEQIDTARDFDLVINITSIPEGGTTIKNPSIWVCLYLFSLFVSNVFFLSNLSVQLCNGQDQDFSKTRTKRGGCKRGLCLAGFGQVITFIHSTVRPNDKKQDHPITSSWSSRVDELSIQFAEFRSNPVYIKVCNDPKHGSSVMVGRWTQDPYPMVLGTECLEPNPTLGVCHVATPSLQLCPALHCLALPQCRHL